jgi:hypothetical protein
MTQEYRAYEGVADALRTLPAHPTQHTPESEIESLALDHAEYARKRAIRAEAYQSDWYQADMNREYERGKAEEAARRDGIEKAIEQSIIDQRVTAERARIVEWVKKEKARLQECDSEAFGYELLEDKCCPGDDAAFGYEKALDHLINHLTK